MIFHIPHHPHQSFPDKSDILRIYEIGGNRCNEKQIVVDHCYHCFLHWLSMDHVHLYCRHLSCTITIKMENDIMQIVIGVDIDIYIR